ncbi:5-hydroxytryptamine receptor 3A [Pholidichthys leucotaenia]
MALLGILLAFTTLFVVYSSGVNADCSYYDLLNHLNVTSSNTALQIMRPVKNWTESITVQLDMVLLGILDVDQMSQTVTVHIRITQSWKNEYLTWTPSEFCRVDSLTLPKPMLWTPDVNIEEDVSDTSSVIEGPYVTVQSNGVVVSIRRQRLSFTCRFNLTMFPFDEQTCEVIFSSMSYDDDSMTLGTLFDEAKLSRMSENSMVTKGEWEFKHIDVKGYSQENKSRLKYEVTMQRKPLLYVINFIIPLFYFLILDLTSFFISEARGEKLSFKVTLLLSISVLLLLLQDMLPSTEANLPMIAIYCLAIFSLVGISVLEAMMIIFIMDLHICGNKKDESTVIANVDIPLDDVQEPTDVAEKGVAKQENEYLPLDSDLLKLILDEVRAARELAGRQTKNNENVGRYRKIAVIADHVFFVMYFIVSFVFMVVMPNVQQMTNEITVVQY